MASRITKPHLYEGKVQLPLRSGTVARPFSANRAIYSLDQMQDQAVLVAALPKIYYGRGWRLTCYLQAKTSRPGLAPTIFFNKLD